MSEVIGKITRISGPIVYAEGLESCGLYDVVDVGNAKLIGEIIRQKEGIATIQVYEDDTGMKFGVLQLDLFADTAAEERENKLQHALLDIKGKFGKNSVLRGINFYEKSTGKKRNTLVGGHNG